MFFPIENDFKIIKKGSGKLKLMKKKGVLNTDLIPYGIKELKVSMKHKKIKKKSKIRKIKKYIHKIESNIFLLLYYVADVF